MPETKSSLNQLAQTIQSANRHCFKEKLAPSGDDMSRHTQPFLHAVYVLTDQENGNFNPRLISDILQAFLSCDHIAIFTVHRRTKQLQFLSCSSAIQPDKMAPSLTSLALKDNPLQLNLDLFCRNEDRPNPEGLKILDALHAENAAFFGTPLEKKKLCVLAAKDSSAFNPYTLSMSQPLWRLITTQYALHDTKHQAGKYIKELEGVQQIALNIRGNQSLEKVFELILHSTLDILPKANNAHIFLYQKGQLEYQDALWADGQQGTPIKEPREGGLTSLSAKRGEPIVVNDASTHPLFEQNPYGFKGSLVAMPFIYQDRVVGVMTVAYQKKHAVTEDAKRLLKLFADQAAVAIENARINSLLFEQANTDRLTGLPNRRAFENRFTKELKRAKRYNRKFSLLFLDLDNFKKVNDRYGHQKGDNILKKVGHILQNMTRDTDFLCRYGGDEFVMLLPEADAQQAYQSGERIQSLLAEQVELPHKNLGLQMGISYGCATYPKNGSSLKELMSAADRALYRDK